MRLNALFGGLILAVAFTAVTSTSVFAEAQSSASSQTVVEIQPGDTLSKIAQAHNTTYTRLFDANVHIQHPDVIYPGEEIRIPATDEVLPSRSAPVATQAPIAVAAPTEQPYVAQQPITEPYIAPSPTPAPAPQANSSAGVWDRLAQCESGGNWAINTGNGYYGGLQFSLSSWQGVGGSGLPSNASKAEQIARAEQLLAIQGWGAWPACTAKLGLR